MNYFIGTDIVTIFRFASWPQRPTSQLRTIFSAAECDELSQRPSTTAPSFLASRFAVKEAFYKAISQLLVHTNTTSKPFFLRACAPHVTTSTSGTWHVPQLVIDYNGFATATGVTLPILAAQVSLAHEKEHAIATVLLSIRKKN